MSKKRLSGAKRTSSIIGKLTGAEHRRHQRPVPIGTAIDPTIDPTIGPTIGPDRQTARAFLNESEAASYLAMSQRELRAMRRRDLGMIAQGDPPQGPPTLWRGRRCYYATETLALWLGQGPSVSGA